MPFSPYCVALLPKEDRVRSIFITECKRLVGPPWPVKYFAKSIFLPTFLSFPFSKVVNINHIITKYKTEGETQATKKSVGFWEPPNSVLESKGVKCSQRIGKRL
jgi:hypothetical protein